ncbi:MAG: shikimate dehydrogenase [Fusobacteriota bacterium]
MVNADTKLICLLGHPVEHSKSPIFQNNSLEKEGINAKYMAFDVNPENLEEAIKGLKSLGFKGGNVTIPHKEEVMKYVDEVTQEARIIGAVNTLYWKNGKLIGDNTDGRGFILSLMEDGKIDPMGKKVLVLGAGGASKAITVKLLTEGVEDIYIYDIDQNRLNSLCERLKELRDVVNIDVNINILSEKNLNEIASKVDLIVNCTPIGLNKSDPELLDDSVFNENQVVFDLIYNPSRTKLLKKASKKGAHIINGAGMLAYQGALSFEKWLNRKPNVKNMKKILERD